MKNILITGPSGVGKGTVVNSLLKKFPEKLALSISCTTRTMRPGDVNGQNYYFISRENFLKKVENEDFLEYETYAGNLYGTLRSEIERINRLGKYVIFETEPIGALNLKKMLNEQVEDFFIAPSDITTLEKMLRDRQTDGEEQILKRMRTAKDVELPMQERFTHVVVNRFGELEKTLSYIESFIKG